jgi:hypothetical protein
MLSSLVRCTRRRLWRRGSSKHTATVIGLEAEVGEVGAAAANRDSRRTRLRLASSDRKASKAARQARPTGRWWLAAPGPESSAR